MDYIDTVYLELRDKPPGHYPLDKLREPQKFTEAVKFLIDGEWLTNVLFSNDYSVLIMKKPEIFQPPKSLTQTWYDRNSDLNNI